MMLAQLLTHAMQVASLTSSAGWWLHQYQIMNVCLLEIAGTMDAQSSRIASSKCICLYAYISILVILLLRGRLEINILTVTSLARERRGLGLAPAASGSERRKFWFCGGLRRSSWSELSSVGNAFETACQPLVIVAVAGLVFNLRLASWSELCRCWEASDGACQPLVISVGAGCVCTPWLASWSELCPGPEVSDTPCQPLVMIDSAGCVCVLHLEKSCSIASFSTDGRIIGLGVFWLS